ncbi:hypothetical protein SAMN05216259_10415 [Actinacidiphila guanduensis]|uniref:Uncharacterized protein n=1 Tax=Actinacidiphila guanduensis TaxID=310781 RepID=A0A1H0B1U8_9ACTN|nr:hypothetical protein SAMN05216259_10415 [Actinacidiphila guanduensis]
MTRAADEGCKGPDAIRTLVAEVAAGTRYEEARAAQARGAEYGRELALRRWERERDRERKRERARAKAAEEAARRTQALEENVHRLLADAGLTPGPPGTTIAELLIARDKKVSAHRLRTAVEAYERAYERREQRHRDSGGSAPWPTPDEVISSLFGPRA